MIANIAIKIFSFNYKAPIFGLRRVVKFLITNETLLSHTYNLMLVAVRHLDP